MTLSDPYKTLGVDHKASDDEIKKAYRNLAKKFHPDKNKSTDAEERFKEIGAAYDLLKDADKRRIYDMQRAGDEEKAANAHSKFQQSSHRSTSTPRPGSARQTRFGQKPGPRTFTFTFATFDDDDDEDFEKFFRASFNDEQKTNAGSKSKNKSKSWRERAKAADGANQYFGERPEWDKSWNDGAQTNSFFSDFDSIFGKQVSDVNHLLNDLLGESPLFKFRGGNGLFDDDIFFQALAGRARAPRAQQTRRSTLADMWDWSVPMFRRKRNDPFASFEDSDDDMADIRFPCIYCGKELSSTSLNAHEAVCKRFYGDRGNADCDSFGYSSSANKNASSKDATSDDKKHWRGNSAHARFRDNKETQNRSRQKPSDDSNQQEENGHVICPWCEKQFHRSIALRHITACELLSPSPSRAGNVPPGARPHDASKPASKNYQSRRAGESSPKKTSVPSFEENTETARTQTPRQSSKANSKKTHSHSSATGQHPPSGRKFMDEPFVMSGSGLHTPRASRNQTRSRPSRSTAHDIGDGLRGKTIYFTKV